MLFLIRRLRLVLVLALVAIALPAQAEWRRAQTDRFIVYSEGSEADLRINDPGVSRKHAMIHVSGEGQNLQIHIEDLGSTNGITVNGTKCREATISDGTRLEIGTTRMLVHSPAGS